MKSIFFGLFFALFVKSIAFTLSSAPKSCIYVFSDIDTMAACYAAKIRPNLYAFSSQRVESENAAMKSEKIASTRTSIYNLTMAEVYRSDRNMVNHTSEISRCGRYQSFKVLDDENKDALICLTPPAQSIVMNQLELARSGHYTV